MGIRTGPTTSSGSFERMGQLPWVGSSEWCLNVADTPLTCPMPGGSWLNRS